MDNGSRWDVWNRNFCNVARIRVGEPGRWSVDPFGCQQPGRAGGWMGQPVRLILALPWVIVFQEEVTAAYIARYFVQQKMPHLKFISFVPQHSLKMRCHRHPWPSVESENLSREVN